MACGNAGTLLGEYARKWATACLLIEGMLPRPTMAQLKLADFTPEQGVLEIRFDNAILLWDNAGALWSAVRGALPGDLPVIQAEPAKTAFRYKNRFDLVCELSTARV